MRTTFLLLLYGAALVVSTFAQDQPAVALAGPPQKHPVVTAAQANGVYRYFKSEFRILALGHNKLKVEFDGVYMTAAHNPNMGYAFGEATIDGNIATFKPPDTERCEITLVFLPKKLKVMQDGSDADCGFGHNVNATGTYRKIKSGKPRFELQP
ncbi:MAG: hypothetical protein ABI923_12235 [bacterium]